LKQTTKSNYSFVHLKCLEGQYDKHKWTKKETTGQAPCPRYLHSSVIVDSVLYVFGGLDNNNKFLNDLYAFDISTLKELIHFLLLLFGSSSHFSLNRQCNLA
jgi:hypothetical protein